MIGSTEEEQVGSETNAAEASEEPSAAASPIETVVSVSDNDAAQAKRTAPTLTSPASAFFESILTDDGSIARWLPPSTMLPTLSSAQHSENTRTPNSTHPGISATCRE